MLPYSICISEEAKNDIQETSRYIAYVLFEPDIADKYQKGILDTIDELALYGGI